MTREEAIMALGQLKSLSASAREDALLGDERLDREELVVELLEFLIAPETRQMTAKQAVASGQYPPKEAKDG